MIVVDGILVSADLLEEKFTCDLSACQGACCVEGDFGAPLEVAEVKLLEHLTEYVKPWLTEEDAAYLDHVGVSDHYDELDGPGTALRREGACVFSYRDGDGIVKCSIESAWKAGKTDFKKPVSCHLYPVRVEKDEATGFEALNYDRWEICSGGCSLGEKLKTPLYRFVREGLVRKYGEGFYKALEREAEAAAKEKDGA